MRQEVQVAITHYKFWGQLRHPKLQQWTFPTLRNRKPRAKSPNHTGWTKELNLLSTSGPSEPRKQAHQLILHRFKMSSRSAYINSIKKTEVREHSKGYKLNQSRSFDIFLTSVKASATYWTEQVSILSAWICMFFDGHPWFCWALISLLQKRDEMTDPKVKPLPVHRRSKFVARNLCWMLHQLVFCLPCLCHPLQKGGVLSESNTSL